MKRIAQIERGFFREDYPTFKAGDTLKVHVKIKEGDKERVQVFQGTVIGRRGSGMGATFTVRKVSNGIGVERIFPLHSPNIDRIELVRAGQVRRAKLNYLRDLTGKSARIKEQLIDTNQEDTGGAKVKPEEHPAKAEEKLKVEAKAEKEETQAAEEAASEPQETKTEG